MQTIPQHPFSKGKIYINQAPCAQAKIKIIINKELPHHSKTRTLDSIMMTYARLKPPHPTRALSALLALSLLSFSTQALAFCGFFVSGADSKLYNDATQVVLMRKGQRTVMSMSNTYKGPTEDFAMVVPVPVVLQKEQVKTLSPQVFSKIDQLSAPRLVEYWEQDPCQPRRVYRRGSRMKTGSAPRPSSYSSAPSARYGVTIEAQFSSGEYQIMILSAKEANGLETWLRLNKYTLPNGASKALAPYIQQGMKFFVAKVDIEKVKRDAEGVVVLSPLRFDFESKRLSLPVRLGLLNASGQQDLLVYILSPKDRYEVANYPNVFIPSNLEVEDRVRESFGAFYTKLFEETLASAGGGVVTEYAWQTSSCDPCPVPPLKTADLVTLGGDVLMGLKDISEGKKLKRGKRGKKSKRARSKRLMPTFTNNFSSWVLTRLHTRYSAESLSEDLVFVPAKPVVGGRGSSGRSTEKPGAVKKSSQNQFQGRYIIRHYWEGEVSCEEPRYGVWGGPNGRKGKGKVRAGGSLGRAQSGDLELSSVVRSALPQLKIKGKPAPKRKGER